MSKQKLKPGEHDPDIPEAIYLHMINNQVFVVVAPEKAYISKDIVEQATYANRSSNIVTFDVTNGKVVYRIDDEGFNGQWVCTRLYSDLQSIEDFV